MRKNISLAAFLLIVISYVQWGCDGINIDPSVDFSDCVTAADSQNYEDFIRTEKEHSQVLLNMTYNPANLNAGERIDKAAFLDSVNDEHDIFRKGFSCRYWSTDDPYWLAVTADSNSALDMNLLDPVQYRAMFRVDDPEILEALNQSQWNDFEVYLFPGVSRVPWSGATDQDRMEALERINQAYENQRQHLGLDPAEPLFDVGATYLYPHASFHQVFVRNMSYLMSDTTQMQLTPLLNKMRVYEEEIVDRLITRAPDILQ